MNPTTEQAGDIPAVFIIGSGHSGSTLLDFLLGAHSAMAGVGELSRLSYYLPDNPACTCRLPMSDCPFWRRVLAGADLYFPLWYRRGADVLFDRDRYRYFDSEAHREQPLDVARHVAATEELFSRILAETGKTFIVDSSKLGDRAELLARRSARIRPRFIHLVRDGRGVVYSNVKVGRSGYAFARKWLVTNLKIALVTLRNPRVPTLVVRYEALASNPERELRRICAFIGVPFEPSMLDFRRTPQHHMGGNPMRLSDSSAITVDEAWKTKLPVSVKIFFALIAGWLNAWYQRTA